MLYTKFQASEPSGSEEEDFLIYFYAFLWFNLGPLARDHLGPWDLGLNKLGKGAPGNATYQISSTCAKQFWRRRLLSVFHF